jgi:hypothetical protein
MELVDLLCLAGHVGLQQEDLGSNPRHVSHPVAALFAHETISNIRLSFGQVYQLEVKANNARLPPTRVWCLTCDTPEVTAVGKAPIVDPFQGMWQCVNKTTGCTGTD